MKSFVLAIAAILFSAGSSIGGLKIATLHPLLDDLAKNVGGIHVKIVPLFPEGGDPHSFSPSPSALASVVECQLVLASGMGLETYLDKLSDNLPPAVRLVDVSAKLPPLLLEGDHAGHDHAEGEECEHGGQDPHWWHSPKAVGRAARNLAKDFAAADPANAAAFEANARAFRKSMEALSNWATSELAFIPYADRELATAHAAFGYFCRDFDFRAFPVQGISRQRENSGKHLAETLKTLREEEVRAIFPERLANEKSLRTLSEEAGVRIGGTLDADATTPGITYESLIRKNVATIVTAFE